MIAEKSVKRRVHPKKRCNTCLEDKMLKYFSNKADTKDGKAPNCKVCAKEAQLKYRSSKRKVAA